MNNFQSSKKKEKKKREESNLLIAEEPSNSPDLEVVANGVDEDTESPEPQLQKSDKVS
jgi:hypothetical protein